MFSYLNPGSILGPGGAGLNPVYLAANSSLVRSVNLFTARWYFLVPSALDLATSSELDLNTWKRSDFSASSLYWRPCLAIHSSWRACIAASPPPANSRAATTLLIRAMRSSSKKGVVILVPAMYAASKSSDLRANVAS